MVAITYGVRGQFPIQALPTGNPILSKPFSKGGGQPYSATTVGGDDQQVAFSTSDEAPAPEEAHVYRVTASQGGQVFGGYAVELLG